ncbi:CHRD domain-containing protein [Agromyces tropicus]|uniref:CHRD domain-containing protein n=1 Tax=Agromyces tropicus TaxID=555371 RepID=A0ABP5GBE0_9MICO
MHAIRILSAMTLAVAASLAPVAAQAGEDTTFTAPLSASQEVPANASLARGQAVFRLSADGSELDYRLIVANLENPIASHIHLAPAGVNGPIVVFLYGPVAPGAGPTSGVLATGTITADDLRGALAGEPLSALVDEIRAGNAYVNVHTFDGVDPITGLPGDIPSGEIRGQIG